MNFGKCKLFGVLLGLMLAHLAFRDRLQTDVIPDRPVGRFDVIAVLEEHAGQP